MSHPVDLADLGPALAERGPGYLLTVSSAERVKVVTVEPELVDGALVVRGPGSGSLTNVERNPAVTLLFPPREERGFSLLVDGLGVRDGDDVRIEPGHAVLHRPAAHAAGEVDPDGCGQDCRPVGAQERP